MSDNDTSTFKDRLYFLLPFFLVALVVLNVVSFFLNRGEVESVKDRYALSYVSFTNELVSLRKNYLQTISNVTLRLSSPVLTQDYETTEKDIEQSKNLGSSEKSDPKCLKTCAYRYLIIFGKRVIRYYGRLYEEGSPMSLGRIARIYPDRVYFEDGDYIENTRNPDLADFVVRPQIASTGVPNDE